MDIYFMGLTSNSGLLNFPADYYVLLFWVFPAKYYILSVNHNIYAVENFYVFFSRIFTILIRIQVVV